MISLMSTNHSVPKNWKQYIIKKGKGETPGPPIIWGEPQSPEEVEPGYGYVSDDTAEEETFYYHSDHLGSTSYITDQDGNITQYTAYLPYGELLVDEHSSSEDLPYKFNGKELDEETGLYYYGARYLNPTSSVWYGVDPLFEEYPRNSAYTYCLGNPVKLVDLTGERPNDYQAALIANHIYTGNLGDVIDGEWKLIRVYTSKQSDSYRGGLYEKFDKEKNVKEYVFASAGTYFENTPRGKASMKEDLAQPFGKSVDMKISLYVARKLDIELKNKELTFVGHSKGGAEAAANAVATNREGVLFNPAAVNLKGYDLDSRKYDKSRHHITAFVVIGEFLDESINKMAKPIDKKIMLTPLSSPKGTFERHKMETVINILKEKNNENKK